MAAAAEGLAAYRLVLRAARRTFAGDRLMLQESTVEIRRRFEDHRGLAPGSDELARALEDAREAAFFIGHGIVQATRGPSGSFGGPGHTPCPPPCLCRANDENLVLYQHRSGISLSGEGELYRIRLYVVKPESVHAGATLEVPSEAILSKLK